MFIISDSCRSVCIRFLELSDANMPSNKGQWGSMETFNLFTIHLFSGFLVSVVSVASVVFALVVRPEK